MCVQSRSTSRRICDLIMFFRIFEHLYLRREMRRNYERNFTHIHFELRVTFWTSIYGLSYGNPISTTKHSQAPLLPRSYPPSHPRWCTSPPHICDIFRRFTTHLDVFRLFCHILRYIISDWIKLVQIYVMGMMSKWLLQIYPPISMMYCAMSGSPAT